MSPIPVLTVSMDELDPMTCTPGKLLALPRESIVEPLPQSNVISAVSPPPLGIRVGGDGGVPLLTLFPSGIFSVELDLEYALRTFDDTHLLGPLIACC